MTRINVGYNPKNLTRQHLMAEHRELKRIPNAVRTGKAKINNIPDTFSLGNGHVKFFYNKLGYLKKRYIKLYQECKRRGYNVTNYISAWDGIPNELMGDYKVSKKDRDIIVHRINKKINHTLSNHK